MITYLNDYIKAQESVLSYLFDNATASWVFDFANEKLFSEKYKDIFLRIKQFNVNGVMNAKSLDQTFYYFTSPKMAVNSIMFLFEHQLLKSFWTFLKKQDLKISDFDSILLRDSIEFLELNEEGISIWDKCKYILSQIKLKANRIDTADLEFYLNMFDEKLKEIATKMQYTDKVEAFLNCNFEVANKNFTKLEAAKNITRMAYMQNPDPNYLVKWVCEIAELPEKKLLKILEIIKE